MPRPLPTTDILSFRTPVVKGADVCVPVLLCNDWAAIRMPVAVARKLAAALDSVTLPPVRQTRNCADEFAPVMKPGGHLL